MAVTKFTVVRKSGSKEDVHAEVAEIKVRKQFQWIKALLHVRMADS